MAFLEAIIGIVIIGATVLFIAMGMWLSRHGGARRWQVWLMTVVFCAVVVGAIFIAIQPFTFRHIGYGLVLGTILGAIFGLFTRAPVGVRLNRSHRGSARSRL